MDELLLFAEMVHAAKKGEDAAWTFLYNKCYPFLYANALRILGNTPAAKDSVQDAFLSAYMQLGQLKNPEAFGGWLKRIHLHNCYRKLRSTQRHTPVEILPLKSDACWENEIEKKYELIYKRSQLFETISNLAEPLRCTLLLRYFSTFQSYEQIATILCVPVGTVRSRLNQAKVKLTDYWQDCKAVDEKISKQSEEWSNFYYHHFTGMYENENVRKKLIQHFDKKVEITFTSGKSDAGRDYFEKEIDDDLDFGSKYQPVNVVSCGNISIVEGTNYNSPGYPDRCPQSSVFVLFRSKEKVNRLNLYNSPQ